MDRVAIDGMVLSCFFVFEEMFRDFLGKLGDIRVLFVLRFVESFTRIEER